MGKVHNKLKELYALLKFMQPAGQARIITLGLEVFIALLLSGFGLGTMSITYVIVSLVAVLLYILFILWMTLT